MIACSEGKGGHATYDALLASLFRTEKAGVGTSAGRCVIQSRDEKEGRSGYRSAKSINGESERGASLIDSAVKAIPLAMRAQSCSFAEDCLVILVSIGHK